MLSKDSLITLSIAEFFKLLTSLANSFISFLILLKAEISTLSDANILLNLFFNSSPLLVKVLNWSFNPLPNSDVIFSKCTSLFNELSFSLRPSTVLIVLLISEDIFSLALEKASVFNP